ncbi:MAG: hypothetical protein C6P37_16385 [Caldibacillus debilis]|uniref:Uncharacterized protein n=1 Tax=Caldibacillus debilis TaxID=301148 RepID=A0A3E0JVD3_9BACI|nr:MAG: hypothetical protein C6P37_16385 [Caldibacillus debilis]
MTNDFVTLQFFFAQWNSLLSHTDIFTEALQYDNITDEQQKTIQLLKNHDKPIILKIVNQNDYLKG